MYHRNTFHWDRQQTPNLSIYNYLPSNLAGAIGVLTANDFRKGRMRHWLLDADGVSITETLSSERDPSPDGGGTIEGGRTWYSYGDDTPADEYFSPGITSDNIAAIARLLPDGSNQYTRYVYGAGYAPWLVTQSAQTYVKPDGTIGELTNYFGYSGSDAIDVRSVSNSLGQFQNFGYNGAHQVTAITNALGQITRLSYSGGNLTNVNFYTGRSIAMVYGGGGTPYLTQVTFQPENLTISVPTGGGFGFEYNGYCNEWIYSNGYAVSNVICGFQPQILEITGTGLPSQGVWLTNTWDNLNRLTSVAYPDGTWVSNVYTYLDPSAHKDRLGNWTHYIHDGLQHLTSTTDARGNITRFGWCNCGSLTAITNALGNPTFLNYNNQGLLTNASFPDNSSLSWQYDMVGRMTNRFDGAGNSLQFAYNNQNLVTAVGNVYGQLLGAYYDAVGRPVTVTNADNVVVVNTYDALNRVINRAWAGGGAENFGYASNGLTAYTNQDNQWTHFGRDGAGRLTALTNVAQTNSFGYNCFDELTSLTDGLNHITTWGYNQYGWLTGKTNNLLAAVVTYAYDADGRVTNRAMAGTTTGYTYDPVGNLTSIIYPQLTVSNQFDAINELTNMTDGVGATTFSYTATGQLQSETGPWASDTVSLVYNQGHRHSLSLSQPSGSWTQSYGYDAEWRMTGTASSSAGSFAYGYTTSDPASALISAISLPNGATINNTYDGLARLTGTALANQFGHVLDGYVYGLDTLGLRTNITRNLGLTTNTVSIGYDGIDELTSWSGKEAGGTLRHNEQLAYAYDAAGNLLTRTNDALVQTFTADTLNQLNNVTRTGPLTLSGATPVPTSSVTVNSNAAQTYGDFTFAGVGNALTNGSNVFTVIAKNPYGVAATNILSLNLPTPVNFQYDGNGNLTNDGTRSFAYDAENQLTNVFASNAWRVGFVYDGLNRRRISRYYAWQGSGWAETNEVHYIYDGLLVLQERDTNNNPQVTYTRGLDLSLSRQGAGGIGGLLARTDTNGSTYYHADGNGNITAMMDGNQNIVARYRYDGFGKLLGKWGSLADANTYRYSSKDYDRNSGTYYYGFRFYEPNFQRWLNRDPIQERGGINLYGFVGNNPQRWVDSFGLQAAAGFDESGNAVWWGPWDQTPSDMPFQQTPYNGDTIPNDFLGTPGAIPADGDLLAMIAPFLPEPEAGNLLPKEGPKTSCSTKGAPRPSPKFKTPTNRPQLPPKDIPPGWRVREMPPTDNYPNGYWRLEKPMDNGGWQGIDPSTMRPGTQAETHVPLPLE